MPTNEEAAVNAMSAQVVYGDDELRRDMRDFIVQVVRDALGGGYSPSFSNHIARAVQEDVGKFVVVNQAREIEKIVARYLTNRMSGDQY
jgi:hypothetical protein